MGLLDIILEWFLQRTKKTDLRVNNSKTGERHLITKNPVDAVPIKIRINNSDPHYKHMQRPEPESLSKVVSSDIPSSPSQEEPRSIDKREKCQESIDSTEPKNQGDAQMQEGQDSELTSAPAKEPMNRPREQSEMPGCGNPKQLVEGNDIIVSEAASLGNSMSFCFMSEKKDDNGEDSDPLLIVRDSIAVVGVFDGMGGAGSAMHVMDGIEKTGAYFASRRAKQATESFFIQLASEKNKSIIQSETIADDLKALIKSAFNTLRKDCPPKVKSGLKSAMIKEFPTTLSVVFLQRTKNVNSVVSLWAGDSRNYLLTSKGLFQISIDDLEAKGDPYENLSSDSPLSNQICADRDFVINKLIVNIKEDRFVVFSATDGCFGYYPTPLHFEDALLRNLSTATTEQDWMQLLKEEFQNVAADDTSMSCVIYGFEDFNALKNSLSDRTRFVECKIHEYDEHKLKIDDAKAVVAQYEESFKSYKKSIWEEYRVDYMSYIS